MTNGHNKLAILLTAEIAYVMLLTISQSALFVETLKRNIFGVSLTGKAGLFPNNEFAFILWT